MEPVLVVEDLHKRFGGVRALDGVSLEVLPGEAVGIIGPNGSGKTTLINLITGFGRPDRGRILYRGRDITRLPPEARVRLGIARSFQMPRPFYHLPAFKNAVIPLCSVRARERLGSGYGRREEVALDLLEEVGFERDAALLYKPAVELPHGYLKRLELARCLALDPELLLLDELFSGVSPAEASSLVPVLLRLTEEGRSLVLVEHRLAELFQVVGRVVVLDFGRKIAEGSPAEIMVHEEVRRAYLGREVTAPA
ncbi:MAG: ATP-binding cassette domain-containing protein [Armatimonadota bacterium]|nr:ATP-binding cassette domain-containing protein [Armatimonadota bacterium]MDR7444747.1 ATP-binding cassette domain-containing protein [Armatimonadota bacterium]MDR7571194.1 ATP-binding cassette domain-containing protein [Armatimonadota bacterium]MDR7613249.1 ATP-binding cassette domain-containing protein [Armatimonadota bacterium]